MNSSVTISSMTTSSAEVMLRMLLTVKVSFAVFPTLSETNTVYAPLQGKETLKLADLRSSKSFKGMISSDPEGFHEIFEI